MISRKWFTLFMLGFITIMCFVFLGVSQVSAVTASSGDGYLIKTATRSSVYYVTDGVRYVFPNEKTFTTWSDISGDIQIVSDDELASYPIGGNVTYRPGVRMVKITTDPKVYVVASGGVLIPIPSEESAVSLYGSTWNTMIDDVPDAFFVDYTVELSEDIDGYDIEYQKSSADSIFSDLDWKFLVKQKERRIVSSAKPSSNLQPTFVKGTDCGMISMGEDNSSVTKCVDSIIARCELGARWVYDVSSFIQTQYVVQGMHDGRCAIEHIYLNHPNIVAGQIDHGASMICHYFPRTSLESWNKLNSVSTLVGDWSSCYGSFKDQFFAIGE